MGSSLQEQFLKMGLVNKKKVNEVKKEQHSRKKSGEQPPEVADIAEMSRQALAEKKKRDQQLNKKKIAERETKEASARVRQLIETHRISFEQGDTPYNFTDNNTIKKIHLNGATIEKLVAGKIGIVKLAGEYQLVPADIIYKIRELNKKYIIVYNTSTARIKTEDDPYAEYQVPDDLIW